MNLYTVTISGNHVKEAENRGYHAYYASEVTAIEIKASNKANARKLVNLMGFTVINVFE